MKSFESIQQSELETHEQSPEAFIKSLNIFDSYVAVTPEMASQPEYKMTFNKSEQELAEGIRGMLENLAAEAMDDGSNVTINSMFDRVDEAILASSEAIDDNVRDELLLVATKMRYNLQVRFQQDRETAAPAGEALNKKLRQSYADIGALLGRVSAYPYEKPQSDTHFDTQFDQPPAEPSDVHDNESRARSLIDQQTGGRSFAELDRKQQGQVKRRLARELHPDIGGDPELYKEVSSQLTSQEKNE